MTNPEPLLRGPSIGAAFNNMFMWVAQKQIKTVPRPDSGETRNIRN
jgi:hypothetical protein